MAKRIKWDEAATAAQNARRKLPALLRAYFARGRTVARGKPSRPTLERFRLRTSRFRYTLELFQSCYGPGLPQRLEVLRQIEYLLDEFQNSVAVRRRLDRPSEARLRHFLEDHERRKLAEFRTRWTEEIDAEGQEKAWRDYLARAR